MSDAPIPVAVSYTPAPPVAPAPVAEAPMPTTPEAARVELATLKQDPAFRDRLFRKDAAATHRWRELHRVGHSDGAVAIGEDGNPVQAAPQPAAMGAEAARQQLALLRNDRAFAWRVANGEPQAVAQWKSVNAAASADQTQANVADPGQGIIRIDGQPGENIGPDGWERGYTPATDGQQYTLPNLAAPGDVPSREALWFAQETRAWMKTAMMPPAVGTAVAKAANSFARMWQSLDAESQTKVAAIQEKQLKNAWGKDFGRNIRAATEFMRDIVALHPRIAPILNDAGVPKSAEFVMLIGHHALRVQARNARLGR